MSSVNSLGEPLTWTDLWAEATQTLGSTDEARAIIEAASGRSGASWLITLTTPAPSTAAERVHKMVERRAKGEPLQYVLGRWGFRRLYLHVDPRVLIPRPETEQVVEVAIAAVGNVPGAKLVDLGTGSGAIALSLALEVPEAEIWAIDKSADALEVAATNLAELPADAAGRVTFLQGSWFEPLPEELKGHLDLVISNPPYVAEEERSTLEPVVVDWEPEEALFSGKDGKDAIRQIIREAPDWLNDQGTLVVEIAPSHAEEVEHLAWAAGFFSVQTGTDLAQRKRWLVATKAG